MDDQKLTLREWLGFNERFDFENAKGLGRFLGFLVIFTVLILAIALFAALGRIVASVLSSDEISIRDLGYVIIGAIGIPFAAWRTIVAQRQAKVAEQGHITDQLTKAVEQLGATETIKENGVDVTQPDRAVRVGGVYGLEAIIQNHPEERSRCANLLASFLRSSIAKNPVSSYSGKETDLTKMRTPLGDDIAVAINVLSQSEKRYAIKQAKELEVETVSELYASEYYDFTFSAFANNALMRQDFRRANLSNTDFRNSVILLSTFSRCDLYFSNFSRSEISSTVFDSDCSLKYVSFENTMFFLSTIEDGTGLTQEQLNASFGDGSTKLPSDLVRPAHWETEKLQHSEITTKYQQWLANR